MSCELSFYLFVLKKKTPANTGVYNVFLTLKSDLDWIQNFYKKQIQSNKNKYK